MTRDEKRLITLAEASKTVTVWDVETGTALFTLAHDDDPLEAAFSPDESRVLTDAGSVTYVWSMRTGELLAKLDHSGIFSGDWSPSGRYILTYQENSNQAFLWDSSNVQDHSHTEAFQ